MIFIGVDAGSSVIKAAAFDADWELAAIAAEPTPLERSNDGRVEANPEDAWSAFCAVLRRVCSAVESKGKIEALGISGAMVGAWVVDKDGNALRRGINWEDARAQPMIDDLARQRPGLFSEIFKISGSVMQQGCTLPVTAALLREEPEVMARAAAVIGYKDWLRARLTGRIATDQSEAAVAPGDARSQDRSNALLAVFGLDSHRALFPDPLPPNALAGNVTQQAARESNLPEGLPVCTGAGDVIANVIGAGGLRDGAVTGLLGTTCMVGLCREEPVFEPPDLGLLFSLPEQHWFRSMVNVAGSSNLDWALGVLWPELADDSNRYEKAEAIASAVPVGAQGVSYLPYLSESGIIAPVADAAARAGFSGLSPMHGRAEMLRAVYEGVAFSIADLCDLLSPPQDAQIVLTGGGGRSALWRRAIAETTGRTVVVPHGEECGALGAAILAATAVGKYQSAKDVSSAIGEKIVNRTEPNGRGAKAWTEARKRYVIARDRELQH